MKLTWEDLLIQDLDEQEVDALLSPWSFMLQGQVAPIFLNKFGSWFLRRQNGRVDVLDVLAGAVDEVADSYESFVKCVNTASWQEDFLLSRAVLELHQAGKVPSRRDCYAIAPHPALSGGIGSEPIDAARVMVISLGVWQSICRQTFGGPA